MQGSLEDREAISEIIYLYVHAIDRTRWDLMEHVFHDDARFKFGPVEGDWRSFIDQAKAIIEPCVRTHHMVGNILMAFEDNDTTAHTEAYMNAMHIVPPDYTAAEVFPPREENYAAVIAGRYIDRFEKRDGEWRIAQRTGIYDWREYRTIGEADLTDVPQEAVGQQNDSDPSYPVTKPWRNA